MRKYVLLLLTVFFAGVIAQAQTKRVAIVTFYADRLIGAKKLDEGARESFYKMVEEGNEQFDIEPILKTFHKTFKDDYLESFPFEIIPEEAVLNDAEYKAYQLPESIRVNDNRIGVNDSRLIPIEGYKVLVSGGNMLRSWRTEAHMIAALSDLDADGVMYVTLYYTWEPKIALGGMGTVGIKAHILMELYNNEQKRFSAMRRRQSLKNQ